MDLSYISVGTYVRLVTPYPPPPIRESERETDGEQKENRSRKSRKQSKTQTQTISRITRMNHQNYQSCSSGGNLANSGQK